MKKAKRILTIACACLVLCFGMLFCGCSFLNVQQQQTTYKLESVRIREYDDDGKDTYKTYHIGDTVEGTELKAEYCILILNSDNTCFLRFTGADESDIEVTTYTWTEGYNNEIYFTVSNGYSHDCMVGEKDGDKITIKYSNYLQVTLTK